MRNVSSSMAGVGVSPSIIAQALPSPLDYYNDAYTYNDDFLSDYIQSLSPGVSTATGPAVVNTPPAGAGTALRPVAQSNPLSSASVTGVGASPPLARPGPLGINTRNLPGRRWWR